MAKEQQKPQAEEKENKEAVTSPETAESKPADAPPKEKQDEIEELTTLHERTIAALSYFGFLAIIPFYLKKESRYCRFHGKQGITLAIIFFLTKLVSVLDLVMDLMLILQAIIALWMGFVALSGRWKKLPLIYKWSCQLEEALVLKTKEEEEEEGHLKPDQVKEEPAETVKDEDKPAK